MNAFKKTIPLAIAFGLGALITYLAMSLQIANEKLEKQTTQQVQPKEEAPQKEEKNWFEKDVDKQTADTEKRIKEQQSQGDDLKSKFDQFAE